MSLFPAYAKTEGDDLNKINICQQENFEEKASVEVEAQSDWLSNSSFQSKNTLHSLVRNEVYDSSSDDSITENVPQKHVLVDPTAHLAQNSNKSSKVKSQSKEKHRRQKRGSNKSKRKAQYEKDVENVYFEDKHGDKGNNNPQILHSTAKRYYPLHIRTLGFVARKKVKKVTFLRYHTKNIDNVRKVQKKDFIIKRETARKNVEKGDNLPEWCTNLESEQRLKVKEYNEQLNQNPNDVDLWLSYIELQDTLDKLPQNQLGKEGQHTTVQRKLAIVEKALEKNRGSMELLKLKLRFMGELLPADDLSTELEKLISNDRENLLLRQALIMVTQQSVAMCTVRRVLDLYSKFFGDTKHVSRMNPRAHDDRLLTMLYRCLIFLRQSGLWEQMWEIICLNLCLNVDIKKENLAFEGVIRDKKVVEMEEVILISKLPLNQLWLRTELLREHCNWISVSKDHLELIGDSRRFVLPEDVADYVHPLLMRSSSFRMAIYFLLALKIPLLPTRDYTLTNLGLKNLEWGVDSSEVLLPFAYSFVGLNAGRSQREELLVGILEGEITSGPQYLKYHPAQEAYIDFLRNTFHAIGDSFSSLERTNLYIWWLRFERILIFISKRDSLKHDSKGKKLKALLKDFFKKEENRHNLYFYKEYALIEREMGKLESCIKILETAINSQDSSLFGTADNENRAALLSVYRTLIEIFLESENYDKSHRSRIQNIFQAMIPSGTKDALSIVEGYLQRYVQEFLDKKTVENQEDMFFLPNADCDMIVLYAYLLYIKDNDIENVIEIFNKCIEHSKEHPQLQELLYESELSLLYLHEERKGEDHFMVKRILHDALSLYPNNFYILSIFCDIKNATPFWKFNIRRTDFSLWQAIATCLTLRQKMNSRLRVGNHDAANATLNKLLSLHRMLAQLPDVRSCPLLWRMYMLLLREVGLCEKKGEEAYHESVAQCPWARGVYVDAAAIAPHFLTQIQDVIREKELRMHVTPEELEILRE